MICVTLPRQVTMLQYLSEIIQSFIVLSGNVSKVKDIENNSKLPKHLNKYIGKIS
jgi:hypothetical protein